MNSNETPPDGEPPQENEWQRALRLNELRFRVMVGIGGCLIVVVLIAYGRALFSDPRQKPASSSSKASKTEAAPPRPWPSKQAPEKPVVAIAKEQSVAPSAPTPSGNGEMSARALRLAAPEIAEARAALEQYLKATPWQEKQPLISNPEGCAPFMREFYEKRAESDPQPGRLLTASRLDVDGSTFICLVFTSPMRPDAGLRANFLRNPAGRLLLDWESWIAWSEKSWPDFKSGRLPQPVLMRAVASESKYYNYEFSDSSRWLAVKLRSPDGLHNVTGYVPRDSPPGIDLANLLGIPPPNQLQLPDGTPMPALQRRTGLSLVTVRLAFPPQPESDHCVKITELVANRWLLFPGKEK